MYNFQQWEYFLEFLHKRLHIHQNLFDSRPNGTYTTDINFWKRSTSSQQLTMSQNFGYRAISHGTSLSPQFCRIILHPIWARYNYMGYRRHTAGNRCSYTGYRYTKHLIECRKISYGSVAIYDGVTAMSHGMSSDVPWNDGDIPCSNSHVPLKG